MTVKKKVTWILAVALSAAVFAIVFFSVRGIPDGSYIRASGIRNGAPQWRFHLTEEITDVYIRTSYYKDGEFVIDASDIREDADRFLSLSLLPSWENELLREFRLDMRTTHKPSLVQFAWTYSFGMRSESWHIMSLTNRFPDVGSQYQWSWLQAREPIAVKKGSTIMLMNIAFDDCPVIDLGRDYIKNPAPLSTLLEGDKGDRIIIEVYFE